MRYPKPLSDILEVKRLLKRGNRIESLHDSQHIKEESQQMFDLGLLDLTPVDVKGVKVVPRDLFVNVVAPRLTKPTGRDLVALRVIVEGTKDGKSKRAGWELLDYYDEARGISAMMRTTGFSLSITGQMQARGEIKPAGVWTPDECVPAARYVEELGRRGVNVLELSS